MKEHIRKYIKVNALKNKDIKIGNNLPVLKLPLLKDIDDDYVYIYFFSKYIDLYDDKKNNMFFDLIVDENSKIDFALFLSFFTNVEKLVYDNSTFIFNDDEYINIDNIGMLMQSIKILHHRDKKSDYYTYSNSLVDRMLKRARESKKKIEEEKQRLNLKNKSTDDDSGFDDVISTVSARHPSINLLNIEELNYYQLLDQYKRLIEIDKYAPVLNGTATEEYVKNLKHYSSNLINDN